MTKPQQRGAETETEKGESSSPAPALHVLRSRGRSITSGIVMSAISRCHVRTACWRQQVDRAAKHCCRNQPSTEICTVRLDLYALLILYVHAWFRTSTRQKRALSGRMPAVDRQGGGRLSFEGDILADGGSWHTRESSKSIFSTITTFTSL